jgi:VTC domain
VRTYGDGRGPRFLEVKRKYRQVILKHRAMVAPDAYDALFTGDWEPPVDGRSSAYLNQFMSRALMSGARPVFNIRYEREAYKSVLGDDARLTFDRQIAYQRATSANLATDPHDWIFVEPPPHVRAGVLLELKANDAYPWWMSEMVVRFNLRRVAFSKYVTAVTHDRELRNRDVNLWPQSVLGRLGNAPSLQDPVTELS